jgi:microcystin-dependent protein
VSDRGHTDASAQYVDRIAGYDQRLQQLERSHVHEPQTPVGSVVDWAGPTAPALWHLCDGAALSRAAYPDLFAAIGTTWGAGDGTTTFNLPDLRGLATVGAGQGSGLTNRALAARGGAETVALTAAQTGAHTHAVNSTTANDSPGHTHTVAITTSNDIASHTHTGTTGSDSPGHTHQQTIDILLGGAVGSAVWTAKSPGAWTSGANTAHTHGFNTGNANQAHQHNVNGGTAGADGPHAHGFAAQSDAGGTTGAGHPNMQPFAVLAKIIRVLPSTAAAQSP